MPDIKLNLENLKKDIESVCRASGRDPSEVMLIAVSKTKPVAMIEQAHQYGINDFGENFCNEAVTKAEELSGIAINWHFIGNLQTNKVKYITKFCSLLHSLDRPSLAEALQKRLEFESKTLDCLIQVNTSGESTKSGISPDDSISFAKEVSKLPNIKVKGLMTIAENSDDEVSIRSNFRELKELFNKIRSLDLPNFEMRHLSMGMSSDYKIAIEEGATMLRIGSTIFGERDYSKK